MNVINISTFSCLITLMAAMCRLYPSLLYIIRLSPVYPKLATI